MEKRETAEGAVEWFKAQPLKPIHTYSNSFGDHLNSIKDLALRAPASSSVNFLLRVQSCLLTCEPFTVDLQGISSGISGFPGGDFSNNGQLEGTKIREP
jgi:hypothetical protein